MNRLFKWLARLSAVLLLLLIGPVTNLVAANVTGTEWWNASREPAGIAPAAESHPEPILQVYAARAFSWRGAFAVHTWVAAKPSNAEEYTVYEVIGWRVRSGLPALVIHNESPDRYWFGSPPEVVAEIRGKGVDEAIRRLATAARTYPYRDTYTVWPGPNSNTFTAWVGRIVPELELDLPSTAVGKDWLDGRKGQVVASAPSGTGFQFSLFGLFGILAAWEEGLEFNLAGLTIGIDPLDLALKLPGIGRIGGLETPKAQAGVKSAAP
ncbi:MAG: DUF3750 domain-containing protein [Alphaproteobacteria bacterium]|nr:DUF3750 domain-containing protein [Alphaproteobacteria bacterium]